MKIQQKDYFTNRELELTHRGVNCKFQGLFGSEQIEISYEDFFLIK